jgi:hypothetical protein
MAIAGVINGANLVLTIGGFDSIEEVTYPASLVSTKLLTTPSTGFSTLSLIFGGQPILYLPSNNTGQGWGNTLFGLTDPLLAKVQAQTQLGASSSSGSAGTMPKTGDTKHSYYTTSHDGWVPLAGQLKSSLTATQQAAATSLGFGANLPNAADLAIVGTSGTKTNGSIGGSAQATIGQTHLPSVNLSGGSHSHSASDSGHSHATWAGSGGQQLADVNGTGSAGGFAASLVSSSSPKMSTGGAGAAITVASSGALTIPLGGGGTALPIQNPYIALNTFIYLGA